MNKIMGEHITLDLYIEEEFPFKAGCIKVLEEAVVRAGATKVGEYYHEFEGGGFTGAIILAESHITIHTWPEDNYVAIDVFTCGNTDCKAAINYFLDYFKPTRYNTTEIERKNPYGF